MSLTSLLKSPFHANLTAWFKHHFPYCPPATVPPMLVKKEVNAKLDYSLVGTAFDYLFRFQLERINAKLLTERHNWRAEDGLRLVLKSYARDIKNNSSAHQNQRILYLESSFEMVKYQHQQFLKDGILTTELIQSSLLLAKLDIVCRIGRTELDFEKEHPGEIEQLRKLFDAVNWQTFVARHQCVLNPTFGHAGMLVGGADADVLIDGVLIDIKVTATITPRQTYLMQLIGYYLLSLIQTKNCQPVHLIHTVALYFPRADYLLTIPLAQYFDKTGFKQRKIEFIGLVRDYNLDLVDWDNNEYLFTDRSSVKYRVDRNDFKCPFCCAERNEINESGQTTSGRYRYKCKVCKKGFSTVFSAYSSSKSTIQSLLFEYRLLFEERECLEKEIKEASLAFNAKQEDCSKQSRPH